MRCRCAGARCACPATLSVRCARRCAASFATPALRGSSGEGYARLAPCECHRARGTPASASYSRRSGGHTPRPMTLSALRRSLRTSCLDVAKRHSVCGGTGAYAGAPAVRSGGGRTRSDALRMTWYVLTRRAGTPCAEGRVRTPERLLHDAEADAPVPTRFAEHTVTRLNGRRAQAAAAIRRQCSSAAPIRLRLASAVRKPEWAESVTFGSVRKGWLAGSGSMA